MWNELLEEQKDEYKKMILAFASLSEVFAQKADTGETDTTISPIINSKYQETVFQRAFKASAEDIGNTSYDAAICQRTATGRLMKYLIGIKTFGIASGSQKVAQFKANHNEWADIINQIKANATNDDNTPKTKEEINEANKELYKILAHNIATLRNQRISSSIANLQGFSVTPEDDNVQSVYHVLMPSKKGDAPTIYVGETSYDKINLETIEILGCTEKKHPTNFEFFDGNHKYRYTSADSQLLMDFDNYHIVQEQWNVKYVDNAYEIFANLAEEVYGSSPTDKGTTIESHSWFITNNNDEVELFSGFNMFFAIGSKMGQEQRKKTLNVLKEKYSDTIDAQLLSRLIGYLEQFLLVKAATNAEKLEKVALRNEIISFLHQHINDNDLKNRVLKLLFRPQDEMYIPIPNSIDFHTKHPTFFCSNVGGYVTQEDGSEKYKLNPNSSEREFNLVFEPSGDTIRSYIVQDGGKAIESVEKQSYLGEWILRGIFQLKEYEPLTADKLNDIGINGIRLWKQSDSSDIHLQFIWLDKDNLPDDYMQRS